MAISKKSGAGMLRNLHVEMNRGYVTCPLFCPQLHCHQVCSVSFREKPRQWSIMDRVDPGDRHRNGHISRNLEIRNYLNKWRNNEVF